MSPPQVRAKPADSLVPQFVTPTGELQAEYAYAGGKRIAILKPGRAVQYQATDHLGSTRRLFPSSETSWAADYFPFGAVEQQNGSEGESRFGFTGHETDFSAELVYAGARYYVG